MTLTKLLVIYIYWLSIQSICCTLIDRVYEDDNNNNHLPADIVNERPIIGVLSQEISYHLNGHFPHQFESFIAASYVKFLEGGGARVVPIWINRTKDYYYDIMSKINGVLLPGGATYFNQSNGYADAGRNIFEIAMEMNNNGQWMPIFGTCLGMELLFVISTASGIDNRVVCSSMRHSLPLRFKKGYKNSTLFRSMPRDVNRILSTEWVTPNFHNFCITKESLKQSNLTNVWRILSVNRDDNGMEFVSTFEHYRYPFFGVQFHPEKNIYEWIENRNISHTRNAIRAAQYFAEFFVDQCRKNDHHFTNQMEEMGHLIYNYPVVFTAPIKSAYQQCYMFASSIDYHHHQFDGTIRQQTPNHADW